jgi:hypothetical protein
MKEIITNYMITSNTKENLNNEYVKIKDILTNKNGGDGRKVLETSENDMLTFNNKSPKKLVETSSKKIVSNKEQENPINSLTPHENKKNENIKVIKKVISHKSEDDNYFIPDG